MATRTIEDQAGDAAPRAALRARDGVRGHRAPRHLTVTVARLVLGLHRIGVTTVLFIDEYW